MKPGLKLCCFLGWLGVVSSTPLFGAELYVSPDGNDANSGTPDRPLATLSHARDQVRQIKEGPVTVWLRGGTYRLSETLALGPEDSGSASRPITYAAVPGEKPVLSGSHKLQCDWKPYRNGILMCQLPKPATFDQLYVNGERQIRARYPNYDPQNPLMAGPGYVNAAGGTDHIPDKELVFNPKTFVPKHWANPSTGIVHAFQSHYWGNMQYRIASVDWTRSTIGLGEGGFQLQRQYGIGPKSRFYVENLFEELDAPGEWFLDADAAILYYFPPAGLDLSKATFEAPALTSLIEFRGSPQKPVHHVTLQGLAFTQTRLTFLDKYEDLGRGDWAIHRGGTVFVEGAEDCAIRDCSFASVGGNCVFISAYNRRVTVATSQFTQAGDSAVCVVGSPNAVRSYQTWTHKTKEVDNAPGPKSPDYPADCTISDNLIHDIGIFGKQTAGVFISMSQGIVVSHNTIFSVPRAGICINDGTWGGHVIEHNDIWDTVRETGEHGPFNAWGRERMWPKRNKSLVLLDAVKTTEVVHNRIGNYRRSVSAGNWTIDLDDGSSNYHIHDNLSIGSTLKLRDGFFRTAENNIFVSPVPIGFHVWPKSSDDVFARNIVVITGGSDPSAAAMLGPRNMPPHPWGKQIDSNLYWNTSGKPFLVQCRTPAAQFDLAQWQEKGYDRQSIFADPLFVDPAHGDYRVRPNSPALKLGFKNFSMDDFGCRQTRLIPFGGAFEKAVTVAIRPDARGGEVRYTLDGAEPTARSASFSAPISIGKTTLVRARTFKDGQPVGLSVSATFTISGKPAGADEQVSMDADRLMNKPSARFHTWLGATLADITDGATVDSLGGIVDGVLVDTVPKTSPAYASGLRTGDAILEFDGQPVKHLAQLNDLIDKSTKPDVPVTVYRGQVRTKLILRK